MIDREHSAPSGHGCNTCVSRMYPRAGDHELPISGAIVRVNLKLACFRFPSSSGIWLRASGARAARVCRVYGRRSRRAALNKLGPRLLFMRQRDSRYL